ncbi:DUF5688 family protein [Butyrivibrio sp.]|uniref:DUF5688 family protein n=1 Tax=Butyrivibrio sp. TaxID=28121 RepID=UPI0025BFE3BC|nr:DUF5688 family protein [Butyrivibrio sp.]MBE5839067.1 hypothetical protein [Butyrivibrio sp.]
MELKGFMEEVKELVNKELGDDYELGIKDVLKNNGKLYHGLEVKKRLSNIAPVLYLDGYYEQYKRNIANIEGISLEVARTFKQHENDNIDVISLYEN